MAITVNKGTIQACLHGAFPEECPHCATERYAGECMNLQRRLATPMADVLQDLLDRWEMKQTKVTPGLIERARIAIKLWRGK